LVSKGYSGEGPRNYLKPVMTSESENAKVDYKEIIWNVIYEYNNLIQRERTNP
jgi:hypothetical protein